MRIVLVACVALALLAVPVASAEGASVGVDVTASARGGDCVAIAGWLAFSVSVAGCMTLVPEL